MPRLRRLALLLAATALAGAGLVACGTGTEGAAGDERPHVVVTTTILGDVVSRLLGDHARVQVLMPRGADPHDVQISARQAADLRAADAVIVNGGGFEAGYLDALDAAADDGVPVHAALDDVAALTFAEGHGHGDEEEEGEHADEEPAAEGGGPDEGTDPHFFTDPDRMADAAEGIVTFLAAEVPALGTAEVHSEAAVEVDALRALATEAEEVLAPIPAAERIFVTNHEVFGYFADRYGFEVVGTVIPGGGTDAEPSAGALADLAQVIEEEGVPAVFADVSSPRDLAEALADEVGDVEVVELFSESLGPEGSGGATYAEMVRTNAERVAAALA